MNQGYVLRLAIVSMAGALVGLSACGGDSGGGGGAGGQSSSTSTSSSSATSSSASSSSASSSSASSSASGSSSSGGASCVNQMYAKYGAPAFVKVSSDLVDTAAKDMTVGFYFKGVDTPAKVTKLKQNLSDYLIMVYGGPNNYKGETDMVKVHTGMNITSDHYDYFIGLIVSTLKADGVSDADIMNCFAPPVVDPKFKASIVGH